MKQVKEIQEKEQQFENKRGTKEKETKKRKVILIYFINTIITNIYHIK